MNGSVPIKVAARVYGKDPCWVRAGILHGWLPIGVATRNGERVTDFGKFNQRTNYYISPVLLEQHTGFIWKGEKE